MHRIKQKVFPYGDAIVRERLEIGTFVGRLLIIPREWIDGRITVIGPRAGRHLEKCHDATFIPLARLLQEWRTQHLLCSETTTFADIGPIGMPHSSTCVASREHRLRTSISSRAPNASCEASDSRRGAGDGRGFPAARG